MANFDPFTQDITMHYADGSEFNVPIMLLDNFMQYCIRICINYGCQLGASIVLLVVLILLTRPEKRRSAVFWLNTLALVCNIARLFCQVFYFTGEFVRIYPYFAHDYSRATTAAYTGSVLGVIFAFLIVVFMEVSLVLQVQVVCATVRRRYKKLLLAVSILVAMIPIGFRFALTVVGSIHIMTLKAQDPYQWLESATTIVITISICFFCTIFVVKLGFAIKLRKKLNVREFGPMKVIFVMGCQTMIVPALFSILQYVVAVPELGSNVLTLVIISLPLSSIWAGASLENSKHNRASHRTSDSHGHLLNLSGMNPLRNNKQMSSSISSDATATTNTNINTAACYAARSPKHQDPEAAKYGISVEHDISIQSYRNSNIV